MGVAIATAYDIPVPKPYNIPYVHSTNQKLRLIEKYVQIVPKLWEINIFIIVASYLMIQLKTKHVIRGPIFFSKRPPKAMTKPWKNTWIVYIQTMWPLVTHVFVVRYFRYDAI